MHADLTCSQTQFVHFASEIQIVLQIRANSSLKYDFFLCLAKKMQLNSYVIRAGIRCFCPPLCRSSYCSSAVIVLYVLILGI